MAGQVDLQRRADEHVARVEAGRLAERAVRAQRAVGAREPHVGARADVVVHPDLRAEAVDLLDPARFDRGNQRRVRIERPVRADLALQAELLAVGRQQQLDRRGVEADPVVQALDPVRLVEALDREHRGQDLRFGDRGRVAREQRLDIERPPRLDDEMHAVARNVDARHLVDDAVDLRDHDAVLERGGLDDGRRVLRVRARVQVAVGVGADRGDQRDLRREVDEVAREQLEIGVHRAERDLAAEQQLRDALRLRARIREVEALRDAALEHVEVLGQHDARLHHVQVVHLRVVDLGERHREQVRLLLVVALEADPVARPQHGFQQCHGVARVDPLALRERRAGREACIARASRVIPSRHSVISCQACS